MNITESELLFRLFRRPLNSKCVRYIACVVSLSTSVHTVFGNICHGMVITIINCTIYAFLLLILPCWLPIQSPCSVYSNTQEHTAVTIISRTCISTIHPHPSQRKHYQHRRPHQHLYLFCRYALALQGDPEPPESGRR